MTKEERREYNRKYRQAHKEKIAAQKAEYNRKYYQSNKEKKAEYNAEYRKTNKDKIAEYQTGYYATPMGRAIYLLRDYRRNDKMHNRGEGDITAKWIVDNIFSNPCHYCGESDWHKLGCDRIYNDKPHTMDNVVPCCAECNAKRGTKEYNKFVELTQNEAEA